jgi:hypothetical protein
MGDVKPAGSNSGRSPGRRLARVGSVTIGVGVVLIVLLAPFAALAFAPPGDCFSEDCQLERRFWIEVANRQAALAFGWPLVAIALGVAAGSRRWLWLVLAMLCGLVLGGGLLLHADLRADGALNPSPTMFGLAVPVISPAFYFWLPGSAFLTFGALIRWVASRT